MEKKTKLSKTKKPANCGYAVLATVDYSKKENQIGCGYCYYEEECKDREPTVNKAKKGCQRFRHYSEYFK